MNSQEYIRLINNQKENLTKVDMENKINLMELLKGCPTDMELNCVMNENVYFDKILDDEDSIYPIKCYVIENRVRNSIYFTKYGEFCNTGTAKCVIFPKGKTTWEGFQRPFKDGDVLFVNAFYSWIFIYKESKDEEALYKYVATENRRNHSYIVYEDNPLCSKEDVSEIRFATEEEKEKLFRVIKDNGYEWNQETKTLKKLIEPKFKVGDRIRHKENTSLVCTIVRIEDRYYVDEHPICYTILFNSQDEYELVSNKFDINTLKPFESRVLVRDYDNRIWTPAFWGKYLEDYSSCSYLTTIGCYKYCIPYEGNEHLLGKTDDCDEYFKNW